ncbi:MAG TPA: class I SAM-dependent methyltransferase [Rhizomicrobium sp.]|nr:class I SAM-dependent methyltransferase [Rhizomicrobium sp.]
MRTDRSALLPGLDTKIHLNMLEGARKKRQPERDGLYGLHWGDPESDPALMTVRDRWLLPYVRSDKVALEIGPGGGRWTRYMLAFRLLYAVDYHKELLAELRRTFPQDNIVEIVNSGSDFPNVPTGSVDFVFSFGVFVHIDAPIVASYLENLRRVVHQGTQIVIQYPDKDKKAARDNPGFADNNPRLMRKMVEAAGYSILEEDTALLSHSAIMRFGLA